MQISVLLENSRISGDLSCNHGLSLFIESGGKRILFDTGQNGFFLKNARKMQVDLSRIDMIILSHGHYDHGGGLKYILKTDKDSPFYFGENAFDKHVKTLAKGLKINIGLDKKLIKQKKTEKDRYHSISGVYELDGNSILFTGADNSSFIPEGNKTLKMLDSSGNIKGDDFKHELNLIVKENGKNYLFSGCSHRGVINIIEKAKDIVKQDIHYVIGGFHLMGMDPANQKDRKILDQWIEKLSNNGVLQYFTGHCTGIKNYEYLEKNMGNVYKLSTGKIIYIK